MATLSVLKYTTNALANHNTHNDDLKLIGNEWDDGTLKLSMSGAKQRSFRSGKSDETGSSDIIVKNCRRQQQQQQQQQLSHVSAPSDTKAIAAGEAVNFVKTDTAAVVTSFVDTTELGLLCHSANSWMQLASEADWRVFKELHLC